MERPCDLVHIFHEDYPEAESAKRFWLARLSLGSLLMAPGLSLTRFLRGRKAPTSESRSSIRLVMKDGTELSAILARPLGVERCKGRAIVMVHGFAAEK